MANEEIGKLNVVVNLDSTGFQNGISNLNRQMKLVQSEFQAATAKLGRFGNSTDMLKLKADALSKQVELQKQKIVALQKAYQKSAETKGEDAKVTQNLAIKLNKAQAELAKLENELKQTNTIIEQQTNRWNRLSTTMQNVGNKMKSVGNKMKDVGKTLMTKVTLPLAGIGTASAKTAMDFEASMSEVKAITGATGEEFKKLENLAKQMGANTSKSATESAQAIKYMGLAGWDTTQIMEGLEPILRLSEAGNLDLARASDLVTDSMSALGITTKELPKYLDQLAQTSRSSNTNIDALAEAFILVGGSFKNLNTPLDEANALLGVLANRGIKGSEAGNSLNSILINLTSGAGQAGKAMQELGLSAFDNEGKFKGVTVVLQELKQKLSGMTEEQKNTYLAMIGGKTQISTLNALLDGLGNEYEDLRSKIQNSNGALNDMATTMQDNLKGKITKLKSALEGAALSIADILIPIVEKATAFIQKWTDKFNALDDSQKELIVKIGLVIAAIGPLLFIIGKLVTIGGTLVTTFGTISTAIGVATGAVTGATGAAAALGTAFTVLTGPVGIAIGAIAGITAAGIALHKHLSQDAIPEVQLFEKETSEATKKAVGAYMELDKKASQSLINLKIISSAVSRETASNLIQTFNDMGAQIKQGLDKHFNESYNSMQNFFANSVALSSSEEAKILADMKAKNEAKKKEIDSYTKQIQAILAKASNEKRALTAEEQQKINEIQEKMRINAVKSLSETELEAKAIMERMKQNASNLSARQAAEVVQNSLKQKEETIKAAEEQYNEVIKEIIRQRDEAGIISEEQAQKLIEEAKRQRDETIKNAEEMHNKIVEEAKKQAKEHVDEVNWETGEILSKWEVFKNNMHKKWEQIKTDTVNKVEEMKKNILDIWTQLKHNIENTWNEIENGLRKKWDNLKSSASNIFHSIADAIVKPFKNIHIPMPHFDFSVSYKSIAGVTFPVPKVDVEWYDRGGIFTRPTIIGVGEKRPEFVGALDDLRYLIRDELMKSQRTVQQTSVRPEIHLHIGTLIADDFSLKQLERKLMSFRIAENYRLGVNER